MSTKITPLQAWLGLSQRRRNLLAWQISSMPTRTFRQSEEHARLGRVRSECIAVLVLLQYLYVLNYLPGFYRWSLQWTSGSFEMVPKMVVDGGNDEFFLVRFKCSFHLYVASSDNHNREAETSVQLIAVIDVWRLLLCTSSNTSSQMTTSE